MNMNDMVLNKNDELKYLILMREEFFKYKLKIYYFRKWKSRALYNHDLLDEDDPFQNNDAENYQNFKNLNYMGQGGNRNSINNNLKNSLLDSKIGNNPNLLIFDDDEQKKKEIKLEDSIKVLDVQKDINNALSNANNIFSQINEKNSKDNENEQYNNILNSLERMKKNVIDGDNLTDNKNNNNNDSKDKNNNIDNTYNKFNDLLIKKYDENNGNNENNENNKDIDYIQKKNDLLSINDQKKNSKSYNEIGKKNSKSQDKKNENEDNKNNKSKNKKKFDPKKLYKYPIKDNNDNDEDKYKDSKYISTKYKNYLHIGQRENYKSKSKSKSKPKNKLNDLYKEIQKNIKNDETLLRRLELKREISNQNIQGNKNRSKSKNKKENILDKLNVNNKNINFNYDNTKNFEENLKNNGFFSGKNKKKENIDKEDSCEDTYPDKIREIIEKYQNKDNFKLIDENNKPKGKKKINDNYDYIKKIKASEQGFYPRNKFYPYYNSNINNNINNVIKSKKQDNEYDEEYEDLFHPKNNLRNNDYYNINNNNNQLNASEYSNSVYNIINNIDDYDNLINGLNQSKYNRIEKKRIVHHPRKSQKSYLDNNIIENSISNNSAYILAPMKDVPITNISFRARMKYFSDKKKQNLEKMIKNKKEEEKQIYTFHPKTGINKLNVIKYDNYLKTENNIINNKKRMPDYERINNLYLDYKDKKIKIDELTKEYYKKAGISFTPNINDKNKEIKEFKNKIGQIPYLDRIDIYNANKQYYNNDKFNLVQKEFY